VGANLTTIVCPTCANILTVCSDGSTNRLECRTCPFQQAITTPIYSRRVYERQEKEDVFGGPGAWDNADKARAQCPKDECVGDEAAFFQVQIRSADEPMTSFFKVGLEFLWFPITFRGPPLRILENFAAWNSSCIGNRLIHLTVYDMWSSVERKLKKGWVCFGCYSVGSKKKSAVFVI
jgi:DNA-directed RNA polymerase III subunit RPC11